MIMEGQLSPGPGCVREYRLQKNDLVSTSCFIYEVIGV
jgi:hypothetical protein